jgi:hypothetical protein
MMNGGQSWKRLGYLARVLVPIAFGLLAFLWLSAVEIPQARAADIIVFVDASAPCGPLTLCSTNGTTGYTGTKPFDLTTIDQWFQIDTTKTSLISGQPAEPDPNDGQFLVVNNTGKTLTSFSLTLAETNPKSDVTYTWRGADVPAGGTFLIDFASMNSSAYAVPPVPEPASSVLFGVSLVLGTLVTSRSFFRK